MCLYPSFKAQVTAAATSPGFDCQVPSSTIKLTERMVAYLFRNLPSPIVGIFRPLLRVVFGPSSHCSMWHGRKKTAPVIYIQMGFAVRTIQNEDLGTEYKVLRSEIDIVEILEIVIVLRKG